MFAVGAWESAAVVFAEPGSGRGSDLMEVSVGQLEVVQEPCSVTKGLGVDHFVVALVEQRAAVLFG